MTSHDAIMTSKDYETYLGDVVCSSGKNDKNIASKSNQGVGAVSQIFATLSQISLGHYFYEIALIFRDTMLVSKLVSSSEIWYNITKKQYEKLESIDEMFFRRMWNVPISTHKEGLYIEGGKMPIRFVIKSRRVMFWWHLVNLDKTELLHKFYVAQKMNLNKGDWVEQLEKDKKELNLDWSDEKMSTCCFNQICILK